MTLADRATLIALPIAMLIASMIFMQYKCPVSAWVCLGAYVVLVIHRLYIYIGK